MSKITIQTVIDALNDVLLQEILNLWNLVEHQVALHPQNEEHQNIIYIVSKNEKEYVLRLSFREERTMELLSAEAHFVEYLHSEKVSVARPIKSKNGSFVEKVNFNNLFLYGVLFTKVKGFSFTEDKSKNKKGIPLYEYIYCYGKTMGSLHKLTAQYNPINRLTMRPDFIKVYETDLISRYLPDDLPLIKAKFLTLLNEAKKLPKDVKCYGLIHTDLNDDNIKINDETGNLTLLDFDDSAYCWFMYDLANAWTQGMKWIISLDSIEKRKAKMNEWFEKVLGGYATEHTLSKYWLSKLEFFLKLVEMREFVSIFQELAINNLEITYDERLAYKIECIEKDIPYFGFFHEIYDPENPFCLNLSEETVGVGLAPTSVNDE